MTSLKERLEEKYIPEPNSGCWLWIGTENSAGYGMFCFNYKKLLAHRVSYEIYKGKIPDGLVIDHLCRNTYCVNPNHLEPVTSGENTKRGIHPQRIKTHCPKGHPYSGENLYLFPVTPDKKFKQKRGCRVCIREGNRRSRTINFNEGKEREILSDQPEQD